MNRRSVLHVTGKDAESADRVAGRLQSQGVEIVERQSDMMLVDGSRETIERVLRGARGWGVSDVTQVPRPTTRPHISRKP
jgi:hypothetical protein